MEKKFDEIPTGARRIYNYSERLAQGLGQLLCGARKFSLEHINRDDIAAINKEVAEISGIPYIMDADQKEVKQILG